VWSLIHTLVANTADPMRAASVEASRALAVWLRQHFMCTNCRGARPASQPRNLMTDALPHDAPPRWLAFCSSHRYPALLCCAAAGFWGNLVVNELGLPPDSTSREAHVRWWYYAHNAVSEHSAATRGGHPYLYPRMPRDAFQARFGSLSPQLACQNPFFLPFAHVRDMWTIPEDDDSAAAAAPTGAPEA
jgi:hypothetical protein